jgi:hypothetical protein
MKFSDELDLQMYLKEMTMHMDMHAVLEQAIMATEQFKEDAKLTSKMPEVLMRLVKQGARF